MESDSANERNSAEVKVLPRVSISDIKSPSKRHLSR